MENWWYLYTRSSILKLVIFCRFGVPASLRREIWFKCFDCVGDTGAQALQEAARGICEWEWLTDDVLRLDVAEHCANDVSYFPFDELVEALVLALSRDHRVSELCESGPPQIPIVTDVAPETLTQAAGVAAAHVEVGVLALQQRSMARCGKGTPLASTMELEPDATTLAFRSNTNLTYDGVATLLSIMCEGQFFDYIYIPWPKLAVVNFISPQVCQAAYKTLTVLAKIEHSGIRDVKQASSQGQAENLRMFLAKPLHVSLLDPGAPRAYSMGRPVSLLIVAMQLERKPAELRKPKTPKPAELLRPKNMALPPGLVGDKLYFF
eukprot:s44_g41.t3